MAMDASVKVKIRIKIFLREKAKFAGEDAMDLLRE